MTDSNRIKVGDTVRLKTGGPAYVVSFVQVPNEAKSNNVQAVRFNPLTGTIDYADVAEACWVKVENESTVDKCFSEKDLKRVSQLTLEACNNNVISENYIVQKFIKEYL